MLNLKQMTESKTETAPVKIKVEKRTVSEKQKEALAKARKSKQTKKILKENSFLDKNLLPSPYLIGTTMIGLGGLAAYYYLKQAKNSETSQEVFMSPPVQMEPVNISQEVSQTKETSLLDNKIVDFFKGSVKI